MAGPIKIAILANGSQARGEIGRVERSLGGLARVGKSAAALGLTAAAVGLGTFAVSAVDAERKYSTSMRLIQASTKASSGEMKQLNDLAVRLGAETSFSAGEAADAMLELARAGLDTKTIMGGGLSGTLTLAAAGGTDLATAATIASNALNTFNLSGRDMDAVAAALAGGANASTASVESLGQALQQVGPSATTAGLSLQETVAALAAFDQAGIKGSDAGTSLKTMLTRLVPSTTAAAKEMQRLGLDFTNADGSFKSLQQIAGELQREMGGLTAEQKTLALNTIFGSDAARAATVLMREGADGVKEYTKATNDSSAAQEAAAARMGGTEGAIERLSGAIETAKLRLGQELAPAIEAGADAISDKFVPAMETGIDVAKEIGDALAPAVSEIVEALGHLAGEGETVGAIFEDILLPALELSAEVIGGLVDFIDDLPGPIKEVGIEAGIAALVFPRLAGAVTATTATLGTGIARLQQFRAELTYTETRAQIAAGALTKLSGAARTAAGIGGMVALTQGISSSNDAMSTMGTIAGATALGFSLGGPWGAAIGAAAGLGTAIYDSKRDMDAAREAAQQFNTTIEETAKVRMAEAEERTKTLAETFDGLKASISETTREWIRNQITTSEGVANISSEMETLGVSHRLVTNAVTGSESAIKQLARAMVQQDRAAGGTDLTIREATRAITGMQEGVSSASPHVQTFAIGMYDLARQFGLSRREALRMAHETAPLKKALSGLRDEVQQPIVTRFRTNAPNTVREVARLARRYQLTPKEIKTVILTAGVDTSIAQVRRVIARLDEADRKRPKPKVDLDVVRADRSASNLERHLADLDGRTANPKAGLDDRKARQGLGDIDRSLDILDGKIVSPSVEVPIPTGQIALVNAALGRIPDEDVIIWLHRRNAGGGGGGDDPNGEPSLGNDPLGRPTADLANDAERAGRDVVARLLRGITGGRSAIQSALSRLTSFIEKEINLKDDKKERAREKEVLKALADEYRALVKNGKAQDANNRKLEKARQHLQEVRAWVDQVKQSFIETGNITQLGVLEDQTVSGDLLLEQLRKQALDAERFAELIRQLQASGLNKTSIAQLLAAGPEAGLATAEALAAGGNAAIKEINQLTNDIAQAGKDLGTDMSDQFFDVGLRAAEGIVSGLEAKQKQLDRVAQRLANQLVKQVKKALKINSPSQVFKDIGDQTVRGLSIGLDDTHVKRSAQSLATSLVDGFGTPALDAFLAGGSSSAQTQPQVVRVSLSAEQVDRVRRGKEILIDIALAKQASARTPAIGPRT